MSRDLYTFVCQSVPTATFVSIHRAVRSVDTGANERSSKSATRPTDIAHNNTTAHTAWTNVPLYERYTIQLNHV